MCVCLFLCVRVCVCVNHAVSFQWGLIANCDPFIHITFLSIMCNEIFTKML